MDIKIIKTENKKSKPQGALGFGKYFSDHMFIMEYADGKWGNARIQPYQPLTLDPSSSVLHYAQGIFEGAKAYKDKNGKIRLFRLMDNLARMCDSAERLCMPVFDKQFIYDAIKQLVLLEEDWIPSSEGMAMYIRPTMIATEPALGVHASKTYTFFVIVGPVGSYYANGLQPVKLLVEEHYVRAAKGGTGGNKVIGNYAASMKAGELAKAEGYDQAMWLDAKYHRYVEEVGAMNIFFVINGVVYTPELDGSILPGITRRSAIQLLKDKHIKVRECKVDIRKVAEAAENGTLTEVFGTGTAAVISPVGQFGYQGRDYVVNGGEMGEISKMLYDELTGIQCGKYQDKYGWVDIIKG
ncbi:MAG: branched-chain amino acid aminotransferase [Clostridiales bacterium]|nr:branched-chain amino acid aminotransferase [Clostridiales bacterium]